MDIKKFSTTIALLLSISSTHAALLSLDSNGVILGASGVIVGSDSYDVVFRDGSCISVYGGCPLSLVFPFQTDESANEASQALFDQVLLDSPLGSFDTDFRAIRGCHSARSRCSITTFFGEQVGNFSVSRANNFAVEMTHFVQGDSVSTDRFNNFTNTGGLVDFTLAIWELKTEATRVDNPSTFSLMAMIIFAISIRKVFGLDRRPVITDC